MIRVRARPGRVDALLPELETRLAALPCDSQPLRHGTYEGDVAALLIWRTGPPTRSQAGTLLAERLQAYGAIDHAVWIPTSSTESSRC